MSTAIDPQPEFAGILKQADTFGSGQNRGLVDSVNTWFDSLMWQSGFETTASLMPLLSFYAGIALGCLVFVIHENLLTTALAALAGFVLPVIAALFLRYRRRQLIVSQIDPVVEALICAVQTGQSVEHGLRRIADSTPAPLGPELKLAIHRLDLGLPLADAVHELPERTGVNSLHMFNTALVVQQQTGSGLALVRERLTASAGRT